MYHHQLAMDEDSSKLLGNAGASDCKDLIISHSVNKQRDLQRTGDLYSVTTGSKIQPPACQAIALPIFVPWLCCLLVHGRPCLKVVIELMNGLRSK